MNNHVKIGPEFFAKIKLDYTNWRWALVREFLQNCFDAPRCSKVVINFSYAGNNTTTMTVSNNGAPMSEDILFNKLLTLGGSGKNFEGENTGGFGVAKSLLYYTHRSYTIRTGNLEVTGSGAQYSTKKVAHHSGTISTIVMDGMEADALKEALYLFASMCQWKGELWVDGQLLSTDLRKGARRKDLSWGVVYTNQSFSNTCIVRLNGQPMFVRHTRYKGCVLIELTGKAKDVLTSNRDGLTWDYNSELSDLLTALAVDKKSALREQRAEYKRYLGEKLKNEAKQPKKSEQGLAELVDVAALAGNVAIGPSTVAVPPSTGGVAVTITSKEDVKEIRLSHEFILKNTTGMVTPEWYQPGDKFSTYSKGMLKTWAAVMLALYQIHGIAGEFSVGFVFDEESEAECEQGVYGLVYYINPTKIVTSSTQIRSFKNRYSGAWGGRFQILSTAAHEFVHGAFGLKEHDEDFAGAYTDVMAKVLENTKILTMLFR